MRSMSPWATIYDRSVGSTPSTRERLLEAAIREIEAGGEAAVRVDVIAEMAEITKPSLYHFFGDREGLIVAAQIERYRRALMFGMEATTEAVRRCSSAQEFRTFLMTWIRGFGAPDGRERRRVRLEVLGSSVSRPALRELVAAEDRMAFAALAEMLDIVRERDWVTMRYPSEVVAAFWYGAMNGRYLIENDLVGLDPADWDDVLGHTVETLLFGPPGTPGPDR